MSEQTIQRREEKHAIRDMVRNVWRPENLKIGIRLTACFGAIVFILFASYAFTLWQFDRVRRQEDRIHRLDEEARAVLRVHTSLLMLRSRLEEVARAEERGRFTSEAGTRRQQFLQDLEIASRALEYPVQAERDPTMMSTLETIRSALPTQIDALVDLAAAKDWVALRLRLQNQVEPLTSLTSVLVEKVDSEVAAERTLAQRDIQRLQNNVYIMHSLAALLSLFLAGLLAIIVTRSITQPLLRLDAAAQALASGNFQHRVSVVGQDELATLARVFNDAARRLSSLYGALQASEARFRTVVSTAPVGIAVLDDKGAVQMFNPKFADILDRTADEVSQLRITDSDRDIFREDGTLLPTNERPSVIALATGKPVLNRVIRISQTGSQEQRWMLTSALPLLRDDGSVHQVILTLTDITEQKKIEQDLRSGRELLAQAQRAGHLGCFDLDLHTNVVTWSPEMADLFGLPAGTLHGTHQDWEALIHPEDVPRATASFAETGRVGESVAEYRIRRRSDQQVRWVESRGRVLFDDNRKPARLVGVTMDITERKQAEEALRQSEEEFHIIFEHAAIGMVLVDPSGHLLRSNPAFRKMTGYSEAELPNLTFADITHPEDLAASLAYHEEIVNGRSDRYQYKKRYVSKTGEIHFVRVTVSAIRHSDGQLRYSVSMVEDVTSQEVAERTLLQLSERLLHIQEEEQRRIAREVHDSTSQEITALTLNLGALKLIQDTLPERVRKQVSESLTLAKRVAREIRTFSYLLHPPMLNELGLWAAMRMFVEEFQERSGVKVDFELTEEAEGTVLQANQELAIFRFVQEALANVHRHSGSKTATVNVDLKDRTIVATVSDAGRGFPDGILKEIEEARGLAGGVGIPGMYERLAYVGGRVEIRNSGQGATVSAYLPIDRSKPVNGWLTEKVSGPEGATFRKSASSE